MRRFIFSGLLVGLAVVGVSDRARAKPANVFQILTGFGAKETCSCAFVVEQSDDYCLAFGSQEGYDQVITIDRAAKTATSSFGGNVRTARFTEAQGCLIDPLP
ncbi:MAG: hypothetical protein KF819_09105 [Labilithrix sp.]|nr:hypothetical protein [Labilithrix sp.]